MAYTIAIAHHAGGVGKTTTALNLGYSLAAQARVLLVDLDPQADLSDRLDAPPTALLSQAMLCGATLPADAAQLYTWEGRRLGLLAGDLESMSTMDLRLVGEQRREDRLRRALAALAGAFDFILVDCPPNISLLAINALYAADGVLIPVQAQDKAVKQVPIFLGSLLRVQQYREHQRPAVLGLLLTMRDDTLQSRAAETDLRAAYAGDVFTATIPRRTALAADGRYSAPIGVYSPDNAAALAYAALAEEVLTRAHATPA